MPIFFMNTKAIFPLSSSPSVHPSLRAWISISSVRHNIVALAASSRRQYKHRAKIKGHAVSLSDPAFMTFYTHLSALMSVWASRTLGSMRAEQSLLVAETTRLAGQESRLVQQHSSTRPSLTGRLTPTHMIPLFSYILLLVEIAQKMCFSLKIRHFKHLLELD